MEIPFSFINETTKQFFNEQKRNSCICGGFGSGKTYICCFKLLFLSVNFKNYRSVVARQEYKVLKQTTLRTFLKICSEKLIDRWDEKDGIMRFINGSEILWMHLDDADEQTLRGLEINSVYLDQPEEISEQIYDILEARVGRWDKARPESHLSELKYNENEFGNVTNIPSYMLLSPNPESETHWIYRRYHPESFEAEKWSSTNAYYELASTDNPLLPAEVLQTMLTRDPAWVKRFVYGKWGISEATIHQVLPDSILDVSREFIENLIQKAILYRILDHGDTAPTCCLWMAAFKGQYFFFREYYQSGLISEHRRNIEILSRGEEYLANYADPQIFKKTSQKLGGYWTVADEYLDKSLEGKGIPWLPADNNEMSTRNRINELLMLNNDSIHPTLNLKPAPKLYFIKKNREKHNYGVEQAIIQTRTQRRVKLGEINGKPIFSDERDDSIIDHAYDTVRYGIASHARMPVEIKKKPSETSFLGIRNRMKMLKKEGYFNKYGDRRTLA